MQGSVAGYTGKGEAVFTGSLRNWADHRYDEGPGLANSKTPSESPPRQQAVVDHVLYVCPATRLVNDEYSHI